MGERDDQVVKVPLSVLKQCVGICVQMYGPFVHQKIKELVKSQTFRDELNDKLHQHFHIETAEVQFLDGPNPILELVGMEVAETTLGTAMGMIVKASVRYNSSVSLRLAGTRFEGQYSASRGLEEAGFAGFMLSVASSFGAKLMKAFSGQTEYEIHIGCKLCIPDVFHWDFVFDLSPEAMLRLEHAKLVEPAPRVSIDSVQVLWDTFGLVKTLQSTAPEKLKKWLAAGISGSIEALAGETLHLDISCLVPADQIEQSELELEIEQSNLPRR
mmetsp:Transcript_41460/g.81290  ORF Transcript_41460/g.81290 Transcript_41460/m.81290 type:complete len:271 (+) Transcript_41460:53-865(+)